MNKFHIGDRVKLRPSVNPRTAMVLKVVVESTDSLPEPRYLLYIERGPEWGWQGESELEAAEDE